MVSSLGEMRQAIARLEKRVDALEEQRNELSSTTRRARRESAPASGSDVTSNDDKTDTK